MGSVQPFFLPTTISPMPPGAQSLRTIGDQRKLAGFLSRNLHGAEVDDVFSGRVGDPLIPKGHDPDSNQYDGKNCDCSHPALHFYC